MITIDGILQGGVVLNINVLNTLTVAKSGAQYSSIQTAVTAANSGTTLWVFPGSYNETVTLKDGVDIVAINPAATTIELQVTDNNQEVHCLLDITLTLDLDLQHPNSEVTQTSLLTGVSYG